MYSSLRKTHRIAMKRQVPRGITQDYLPHNKGKRAPAPHLNPCLLYTSDAADE